MTDTADAFVGAGRLGPIAARLGCTEGQVWTTWLSITFVVGLSMLALPGLDWDAAPLAAAPSDGVSASAGPATDSTAVPTPAAEPSAAREQGAIGAPGSGPAPATPSTGGASAQVTSDPSPQDGPDRIRDLARIDGPGKVRATAVADEIVAVVVDDGAGVPGRLVLVDMSGDLLSDMELEIGDVTYEEPGGVTATGESFLVATANPAAVLRIDPAQDEITKVADIPDVPVCLPLARTTDCQTVVPDSAPSPRHLVVDERGDVYVADQGQACIHRIALGEDRAKTWLCDLSFAASPAAPDGGLLGLASAPGRLLFTVTGIDGVDSIHEVEVRDRSPGEHRRLAEGPDGGGASGLVVLPDGRIVVTLAHADSLLVIDAAGTDSRSVTINGVKGPSDVEVAGETLFITHRADGGAGRVSRGPVGML